MDEVLDEYELAKLLEHIADCVTDDEYDELDNLLSRVDRLREKGLNVDFKKVVPVLVAYADKISGYIKNEERDDAKNVMERLKIFLEDFGLSLGKESASRISNAYTNKITGSIKNEEHYETKAWIDAFKQFLKKFNLTADQKQVSKIIDSHVSLVKSCIDAKEFDKADKLREKMKELKNMIEPLTQRTDQKPSNDKKPKGLHCVYCGKKLPTGASFCPNCESSQD